MNSKPVLNYTKNSPKFICFVGTDGAGKTTLAKAFNHKQKRRLEYQYFDGGLYYTYLMRPIRKLAATRKLKKENKFKDFEKYQTAKKEVINSTSFHKILYAGFLLFDYGLLVFVKVTLPMLCGRRITAARYVYDLAIKFKIFLNLNDEQAHKLIRRFTAVFPNPDYVFFIDVPEEVALERKDDVPSLSYLTERRRLFHSIMQPYMTAVLDGRRPINELVDEVESHFYKGQ